MIMVRVRRTACVRASASVHFERWLAIKKPHGICAVFKITKGDLFYDETCDIIRPELVD